MALYFKRVQHEVFTALKEYLFGTCMFFLPTFIKYYTEESMPS